jgi:hypothetical protein
MVVGYNISLIVISYGLNEGVPIKRRERERDKERKMKEQNKKKKEAQKYTNTEAKKETY